MSNSCALWCKCFTPVGTQTTGTFWNIITINQLLHQCTCMIIITTIIIITITPQPSSYHHHPHNHHNHHYYNYHHHYHSTTIITPITPPFIIIIATITPQPSSSLQICDDDDDDDSCVCKELTLDHQLYLPFLGISRWYSSSLFLLSGFELWTNL